MVFFFFHLLVFAFCLSVVSVLSVVSRYCLVIRKRNIQFSISSGKPANKSPPLCSSALPLTSLVLLRIPFLIFFAKSSATRNLCPFAKRLLLSIPSLFLDHFSCWTIRPAVVKTWLWSSAWRGDFSPSLGSQPWERRLMNSLPPHSGSTSSLHHAL